jgi:hypothetical protein
MQGLYWGIFSPGGIPANAGGVTYGFLDTRFAAYRYREHMRQAQIGWRPVIVPGREGDLKAGAMAYLRF